jgi:predicted nucleic acid-binding protein
MNLIVDASAAFEFVRNRPSAKLIGEILSGADMISTPDLFVHEITNALWKINRIENHSPQECERLLHRSLLIPDEFITGNHLTELAFQFGQEFDHPTYDFFYMALAKEYKAPLLTLDKKLMELCKKARVPVCEL